MRQTTRFYLDHDESMAIAEELLPLIGLARIRNEVINDDSPETQEEIDGLIDHVERHFNSHNLAWQTKLGYRVVEERQERAYSEAFSAERIADLCEVLALCIDHLRVESEPDHWRALGMPEAEGLAEMRFRSFQRLLWLAHRLAPALKAVTV